MKQSQKVIKRFIKVMLFSGILIVALNMILMMTIFSESIFKGAEEGPWSFGDIVSEKIEKGDVNYKISEGGKIMLENKKAWAFIIDNETNNLIWKSDNTPSEIPSEYSLADIAILSRTYLRGYPTFTYKMEDDLLVIGYEKETYWKLTRNSFDYSFIKNMPFAVSVFLIGNILVVCFIYVIANKKLFNSIGPIIDGVESLANGDYVELDEYGVLSDVTHCINETSAVIKKQSMQLRKKEKARANWISGVSHDIRTPLSMVMGYASQIESSRDLKEDDRRKIVIIRRQSQKIKNLIKDLNLASKLEYEMQPMKFEEVNLISIIRGVIVEFMNNDFEENYPVNWNCDETNGGFVVKIDKSLIKRATENLMQNSMNHNPRGCQIYVEVKQIDDSYVIKIEDDGVGISKSDIEKLQKEAHYLICDGSVEEQRHGLGLLIVKQILKAHDGMLKIGDSVYGGFRADMIFKKSTK